MYLHVALSEADLGFSVSICNVTTKASFIITLTELSWTAIGLHNYCITNNVK